jgi:hypothetical protein
MGRPQSEASKGAFFPSPIHPFVPSSLHRLSDTVGTGDKRPDLVSVGVGSVWTLRRGLV